VGGDGLVVALEELVTVIFAPDVAFAAAAIKIIEGILIAYARAMQ